MARALRKDGEREPTLILFGKGLRFSDTKLRFQ
jgi:hypothetical protein